MLDSFMSASHTLKVISEEGTSIKTNASIGHAQVCGAFSLQVTDVEGPSPLRVRDLPGLVVLAFVRTQAGKPVTCTPPWPLQLFLPTGSCPA